VNLTRRHDAGRTRGITCRENLSKKTYEDDNPVVLTAYQAAKCAASVSAALAGDPAWTELAQKVGAFLDVSAAEAKVSSFDRPPRMGPNARRYAWGTLLDRMCHADYVSGSGIMLPQFTPMRRLRIGLIEEAG